MECGGHAMRRSCPICEGRCGREWKRDISMVCACDHHNDQHLQTGSCNLYLLITQSHQLHSAHWDGVCGLSEQEWTQHAMRTLAELDNAAALGEALEDVQM